MDLFNSFVKKAIKSHVLNTLYLLIIFLSLISKAKADLPPVIDLYESVRSSHSSVQSEHGQEDNVLKSQKTLEQRVVVLEKEMRALKLEINTFKQIVPTFVKKSSTSQAKVTVPNRLKAQPLVQSTVYSSKDSQKMPSTNLTQKLAHRVLEVRKQEASKLWKRAMDLLQKDKYTEATRVFEIFIKSYPNDHNQFTAQYFLGQLALLQGDPQRAINYFKSFIQKNPQDERAASAQFHIGLAYYAQGDYPAAFQLFEQIKATYPNTSIARQAEQQLRAIHT